MAHSKNAPTTRTAHAGAKASFTPYVPKYFTSTCIIHGSLFSKIIAYAFAAYVRVHAEERATRFRRLGTPGEEEPRTWRCWRDKLEGHGCPPVHDSRLQLDLSAHLRLRRQSAVFCTSPFLFLFFPTHHTRAQCPFACLPIFHHFAVARDYPRTCLRCTRSVPSSQRFFITCPHLSACDVDRLTIHFSHSRCRERRRYQPKSYSRRERLSACVSACGGSVVVGTCSSLVVP